MLQLSDSHLFADADARLMGRATRATFEAVLAHAQAHHWPPAAIILTGDLVHDETLAGYRYLRERLHRLAVPCHCLPGNHDRVDLVAGLLDPHSPDRPRVIQLDGWELILLDSTIPNEAGGYLDRDRLAQLDHHLSVTTGVHFMIALHHHPLALGSAWLDTMVVRNGAELLAIADRHPRVRALIWGHVHQEFAARRGHVRLLAAPSTCVQFLPGSQTFALDRIAPGYRWFTLAPDGQFATGVERIDACPDALDLDASGY